MERDVLGKRARQEYDQMMIVRRAEEREETSLKERRGREEVRRKEEVAGGGRRSSWRRLLASLCGFSYESEKQRLQSAYTSICASQARSLALILPASPDLEPIRPSIHLLPSRSLPLSHSHLPFLLNHLLPLSLYILQRTEKETLLLTFFQSLPNAFKLNKLALLSSTVTPAPSELSSIFLTSFSMVSWAVWVVDPMFPWRAV